MTVISQGMAAGWSFAGPRPLRWRSCGISQIEFPFLRSVCFNSSTRFMKLSIKTTNQKFTQTDFLVILSKKGAKLSLPDGVKLPKNAVDSFEGRARETRLADPLDGPAKRVLLLGLGGGRNIDTETLRRCGAIASKQAEKASAASSAIWFDVATGRTPEVTGQALAEGVVMGTYHFDDFKKKPELPALRRTTLYGNSTEFNRGARRGESAGAANCLAKRLQDTPGNLMRPRDLVAEAKKIAKKSPHISIDILDEKKMKELGMGALLSVSRGSSEPAYLIHLIYRPTKSPSKKICFVGKGLTFDAGGISIKPSARMEEMKYDMSGGAAVLGVFQALAELNSEVEVHGLVPASENLPDGRANKPGDLVVAMNGLSIEILNTDAEGRLILADAMSYAVENIKPDHMIDLATLTGAAVVALGHEYSGVMGSDQRLVDALVASGERTGELVWPLPIHDLHKKDMKGRVGDLKNIGNPSTGAGASTAAAFLSHFAGDVSWAHLDIAGSAWGSKDRDYQTGNQGTGVGVRLLIDYLDHLS